MLDTLKHRELRVALTITVLITSGAWFIGADAISKWFAWPILFIGIAVLAWNMAVLHVLREQRDKWEKHQK